MRAMHMSSANIQRRANPLINLEPMATRSDSDDIGDRIHGSNLVKMNALHRNVMDLRLRMAQQLKGLQRNRLHFERQARVANDPLNHSKRTPVNMRLFVRMIVRVTVVVRMRMIVRVGMFPVRMSVLVLAGVGSSRCRMNCLRNFPLQRNDIHFGSVDPAAINAAKLQLRSYIERCNGIFQN